jgi:hypothetical protein
MLYVPVHMYLPAAPAQWIVICTLQSRSIMDAWLGGLANLTATDLVPWEQQQATELLNRRADLRAAVRLLNASYLPSL